MLIKRVYEVDPLACPECGGRMKVISFIEPPQEAVIERILRHCGLWRQEPNQEPRGPPEESERTFVPDEDDPLPPKERKRSAAGGELTFVRRGDVLGDVLSSRPPRAAWAVRARRAVVAAVVRENRR